MKIEVESEALDSIKRMAQQLQEERDELLAFAEEASGFFQAYADKAMSRNNAENIACELHKNANSIIDKCTSSPKVME